MRETDRPELTEREVKGLEKKLVKKEVVRTPEIWKPQFSVLTISGPSGTGKTAVAELLAKRYGIPSDPENPDDLNRNRVIKVGEKMRKMLAKKGKMIGFVQRDVKVDKKIDHWQAELIRDTSYQAPIILEGRVAGIIAAEKKSQAKKNKHLLPVVSLLLYAKAEIRFKRILERETKTVLKEIKKELRQEPPEADARELYPDKFEGLTLGVITQKTREREKGDLLVWERLHPIVRKAGPFGVGIKDDEGSKVYDYEISTSPKNKTVEAVAEAIHQYLVEKGWVVRVDSGAKKNGNGNGS